jgi:hypothetical protein
MRKKSEKTHPHREKGPTKNQRKNSSQTLIPKRHSASKYSSSLAIKKKKKSEREKETKIITKE